MTDVFALAGTMATTIFERAKQVILWFQANLADREFRCPISAPTACSNVAPGTQSLG